MFFVVVMFEAKLVKSFLALMLIDPPAIEDTASNSDFILPERLLVLLAMVKDCRPFVV